MSGTLFVVATPIGNLEDITLRALRVLRQADVIAAEDTRRTAKLLAHHGISTPMLSFHEHNTRTRVPQLVARLKAGTSVAVVTDAGTPGISDPGAELVRACIEQGIRIEPIPGASAPLTAAVASGFPLEPLTILGFAPNRSKDRIAFIAGIYGLKGTVVFFEAPHRILATLTEIANMLGDRPIMVGRELTKAHEEFLHGRALDIVGLLPAPRGEFTVVVSPAPPTSPSPPTASPIDIFAEFGQLTQNGASRRAAIASLARKYGLRSNEIYSIIEKYKMYGQ